MLIHRPVNVNKHALAYLGTVRTLFARKLNYTDPDLGYNLAKGQYIEMCG